MTTPPTPRLHVVRGATAAHLDPPALAAPRTSWTAAELMALEFPPPRWAVPGILAEGVSLLAGPPKVGKSWLTLGLALAVAAGGHALGTVPVDGGPVLYLALEDTPRRLQSRMGKLLQGRPAPAGLTLATSCATLPDGGDRQIGAWLDRHPDARMVVIDVLAKIRGSSAHGSSAYDADYTSVGAVKRIADHYGVAVVLVHHVRKAAADDFLAEVSGTNGLAGAADATLVLKRSRGTADGQLHITGRDVTEDELALAFDPPTGAWRLLPGPAADHAMSEPRATVARYLREHGPAATRAVADGTGLAYENVKKTLQRMADAGQLTTDAAGRYAAPHNDAGDSTPTGVPAVPAVPEPP